MTGRMTGAMHAAARRRRWWWQILAALLALVFGIFAFDATNWHGGAGKGGPWQMWVCGHGGPHDWIVYKTYGEGFDAMAACEAEQAWWKIGHYIDGLSRPRPVRFDAVCTTDPDGPTKACY